MRIDERMKEIMSEMLVLEAEYFELQDLWTKGYRYMDTDAPDNVVPFRRRDD